MGRKSLTGKKGATDYFVKLRTTKEDADRWRAAAARTKHKKVSTWLRDLANRAAKRK